MDNRSLIAFNPVELQQSHDVLKTWLVEKYRQCLGQAKELRESFEMAKKHKWKSSSIGAAMKREENRANYYDKALKAVEAGYLLIPPFPLAVFAVRTNKVGPPAKVVSYKRGVPNAHPSQNAPGGEGEYVDNQVFYESASYKDEKGNEKETYWATRFDSEIDFPLEAIKPELMERANKAMLLKIFDEIGLVSQRDADPILVGSILYKVGWSEKRMNFFLAWWLDKDRL